MPYHMKRNRHKRPIIRRRGRNLQAGTGVSHRDMIVQRKKWMLFTSVPFVNASTNFSYGLSNLNVTTGAIGVANSVYNRLITLAAASYEEYRIRRIVVYGQPGVGYTNDLRIKSSIFSRVDVNSQPTTANLDTLNSLISSESSVNKTFLERGNVKLADYRPICYSSGGSGSASRPILPPNDQWYNIEERDSHIWRGATVAPIVTDTSIAPNTLGMTCWLEVEMDFRSRRPDFESLSLLPTEPEPKKTVLPPLKETVRNSNSNYNHPDTLAAPISGMELSDSSDEE